LEVKEIMAIGAVTIEDTATVSEAAALMRRENVGMLVVRDESAATRGVVTDRDLFVRCVGEHHNPRACKASTHMSHPALTTRADADALDAARLMRRNRIRRLPVTDAGELVGVVSFSDIARAVQRGVHDVLLGSATPRGIKAPARAGTVTHYYTRLGVAGINLDQPIRRGDRIYFTGHTTDFDQVLDSIEIDHQQVDYANSGQPAAIRTNQRVRPGDGIFIDTTAA